MATLKPCARTRTSRSSTSASGAPIARASATARATSDESDGSHSNARRFKGYFYPLRRLRRKLLPSRVIVPWRLVRLGDPAVQHHDLDGPADSQCDMPGRTDDVCC